MAFAIPDRITMIMRAIARLGRESFVVGGAVRDLLLGRTPKDYDLATDARPEEIAALAAGEGWKAVNQPGRDFGVVVVAVGGEAVEIATYRGECYGADSHRPERVWYAATLAEDLSRRDFTCNALALDLGGRLYDPFGGRADLDAGLIRTVGLPEQRFAEDALRMFRACRFAAELGFAVDPAILAAIPNQLSRVGGLSLERVREEIQRTLLAEWPALGLDLLVRSGLAGADCRVRSAAGTGSIPILPELAHLVELPQNPRFHAHDVWRHTLRTVQGVPREPILRWAALLHDVAKGLPGVRGTGGDGRLTDYGHDKAGAAMAEAILRRFGFGRGCRSRVAWLIARHMRVAAWGKDGAAIRRWLRGEARSGIFRSTGQLVEAFSQLGALCLADMAATGAAADLGLPGAFAARLVALAGQMPVSTADLRYDSGAVRAILGGAEAMGPLLKNVLNRVQDGVLENSEEAVEQAAARWAGRRAAKRGGLESL